MLNIGGPEHLYQYNFVVVIFPRVIYSVHNFSHSGSLSAVCVCVILKATLQICQRQYCIPFAFYRRHYFCATFHFISLAKSDFMRNYKFFSLKRNEQIIRLSY